MMKTAEDQREIAQMLAAGDGRTEFIKQRVGDFCRGGARVKMAADSARGHGVLQIRKCGRGRHSVKS